MIESILISAATFCAGSVAFDDCVHWFAGCMFVETMEERKRLYDDAEERCAERIPEWAWEGL